ncbi:MAG: hypothetical protein WCC60_05085 [Ilumatobacteraceae bacterium]
MSAQQGSSSDETDAATTRPLMAANPLLDAFREAMAAGADTDGIRDEAIARYGFAIPTGEALDAIGRCSPAGVVEVGAGTGYWASLLHARGLDVVAFDLEPAPSPQNKWFAGVSPWHPVHRGDHRIVGDHPERTLLVVWPTKDETWGAAAIERYHDAGGQCLVFVGEGPGGRTGDATFHTLLGELSVCLQCEYGSMTSPCTCGIAARWQRTETIELPHWPGFHDDLHIYAREPVHDGPARRARVWRRPARRG